MHRAQIVERSLRRQKVERTSCFPLVDASFAATFAGRALADVQLDPDLHARAVTRCIDGLPIDGAYVNLCFSREQASGAELRDGQYRVIVDECLELEFGRQDGADSSSAPAASSRPARQSRRST